MAHPGPHLLEAVGQRDGPAASFQVRAHRDHARHPGADRTLDDAVWLAELLEVKVCVYEDADSPSTTSSSRLKSASGVASARPGGSTEGRQRSVLPYSPVITVCDPPSSANSRTCGCSAITS